MRIFIEIRGGAFQGATVEDDCGPIRLIVCDRDNLEAGDEMDLDGVEFDKATPEEMDAILAEFDPERYAEEK